VRWYGFRLGGPVNGLTLRPINSFELILSVSWAGAFVILTALVLKQAVAAAMAAIRAVSSVHHSLAPAFISTTVCETISSQFVWFAEAGWQIPVKKKKGKQIELPRGSIGEVSKTNKGLYANDLQSGLARDCWTGDASAAALLQLCAPPHSYRAFVVHASKSGLRSYV